MEKKPDQNGLLLYLTFYKKKNWDIINRNQEQLH